MRRQKSLGSEWERNKMKISKQRLQEIIKEEVNKLLIESNIPPPPKAGPAKEREDLPRNPNEHEMIKKVKNSAISKI